MMTVRTELRHSAIDGIGVFALESIPAGSIIWRLDERFYVMLNRDQFDKFPELMKEHFVKYSYPHMTKPHLLVCDIDNGRFMNHSVNPNTDFTGPEVARAVVDIQIGEEITCNYFEFDPTFVGFGD